MECAEPSDDDGHHDHRVLADVPLRYSQLPGLCPQRTSSVQLLRRSDKRRNALHSLGCGAHEKGISAEVYISSFKSAFFFYNHDFFHAGTYYRDGRYREQLSHHGDTPAGALFEPLDIQHRNELDSLCNDCIFSGHGALLRRIFDCTLLSDADLLPDELAARVGAGAFGI